uniref:Protein AHNAK2 n=1 Tax=Amazona collaria TaxID=241587 RepID=A0A8B9FJY5_9PSIT
MSSKIDTEVRETATDDQVSGPDLDLGISAGKAEQESPSKKPQFVMPKISLSKIKVPKPQTHSSKVEADTTVLKSEREVLTADIEAPKVDVSLQTVSKPMTEGAVESLEEKYIKLKEEYDIKAEEGQTEEHQGWFKMPKFRIPAFGRTSLKEKKGDACIERFAEITVGKQGIPKVGDSVKSSDVSLAKVEGDVLLSTERTDSTVNMPKAEAYADIVKHSSEGQKMHTSELMVSPAEFDKANSLTNRFSTYTLTLQEHKIKSHDTEVPKAESSSKLETSGTGCTPSSAETTLDATQEKTDVSLPKEEVDIQNQEFQKLEKSIGLESPALDHMEASARITVDKSQGDPEVNIKIPKLNIPRFTFKALPIEADVSVSKVVTDPKGSSTDIEVVKILTLTEPDIKTAQMATTIGSSLPNAGQDIHWSYVEGQEVSEKVEPEHVAIERCEIYTTEIVKESEILSSEVKTTALGFSLLKVKLPEPHSNLEVLVQQPSPTEGVSVNIPKYADESFGGATQRTGSAELKLSDKLHSEIEESSGEVSLPKLKTSAVEVKPSTKLEESLPGKSLQGITADPFSKDEGVAEALEDEEKDIINEKEKTDSKRSPGRFKFWLPSVGFSSSGDETRTDSKTEVKKSVPEDVKPADTSGHDSSKQTEKTGWFRFPKLGFTSPSKKAKTVDKEEMGQGEGRISDEDSPSDKPDVFFDAQESLSPKDTTEGETVEIDVLSSNVPVSRTIVTSSARTELILLEKEKDSQSNIPGDKTK